MLRKWLRTKLRKWLGIEATDDQGKSFQEQIQEVCDIDGNQPAAPHIPDSHWQKTKLGGAINELRANHAALLHHIGPPYLPEPRGVRTVYMELEHLRNRVKKLEPADKSPIAVTAGDKIIESRKKKPRTKAKK